MTIFISVVLPVLLVFLIGYVVQIWRRVDIKPVSTVAIYILTPALVFETFYKAEMNMQYVYMVVFALILLFALIIINKLYAWKMKYNSSTEGGLILSTAFMNSGNYGAPIILFAYGQEGFAYAVSFMVLQSVIMNFFGVYYAARGVSGVKTALQVLLRMPVTYAVILAVILKLLNVTVPDNLMQPVELISQAAIPTVMLILGMQLAQIKWTGFEWGKVSYGVVVRLLLSPLIAWGITLILPLDPLLAKVLIVASAMPSAATIVMYAVEFDAKPKLVSSITLITTLLSVLTLTLLLVILG
ncbi:AEC family transporter [Salipaludibacillus sp. CUR1]|uniref:AEC family transporter n=1 Tax=Salipaludibacillus sp. CUR1 TaxID=2820003 RepID=UPI001E2D4F63|nr:AEC family transporter [Salipaludibacillus sp. CUR1]MCE7792710.1 AEC family transporter [Salipaludibacillus sp. CUR1]